MAKLRRLEEQVEALRPQLTVRAKSLIITIFGDTILPHGGTVWLGSLITLVDSLGMSERMVRTAIFRLTRDGWVSATQIGRRSYYAITEPARRRFEVGQRRIYGTPQGGWDGNWLLVLMGPLDPASEQRDNLRRELSWQGFAPLAPGVMGHPSPDETSLRQTLTDLKVGDDVVVFRARREIAGGDAALRALVWESWDLERLANDYEGFLNRFRPLWRAISAGESPDDRTAFVIRTLLIHDYRRVLLRDPVLPEPLLAGDWPGAAARLLCRNLYRAVQAGAERHLMETLETADGPLPNAAPFYAERFGGLMVQEPRAELLAAG